MQAILELIFGFRNVYYWREYGTALQNCFRILISVLNKQLRLKFSSQASGAGYYFLSFSLYSFFPELD